MTNHPDAFFYQMDPFPIYSAPKDGTSILAWDGSTWAVISWLNSSKPERSRWIEDHGESCDPILWYPLPQEPSS